MAKHHSGRSEPRTGATGKARQKRPRWNADRAVGPRTAFTPTQVLALMEAFENNGFLHDLALLTTGVDTMLRASDLLQLRVRDVITQTGAIRADLVWRQRKTGGNVTPTLTETARTALARWIRASGKQPDHFLFTRTKAADGPPITSSSYRRAVKVWARLIGLDPTDYSSHSIRRTKPVFMYRAGCPISDISSLLGHRSNDVTRVYLGISAEHLRRQALAFDLFAPETTGKAPPPLDEAVLDALAERIARKLQAKNL